MASRHAQIRMLLHSVPPAGLGGASLDSVQARCEANLAATDVWAASGNTKQVRQAGTGLAAICAWHAVQALTQDANVEAFQRASGLSPAQFAAAERDVAPAFARTSQPKQRALGSWALDETLSGGQVSAGTQETTPKKQGAASGSSSALSNLAAAERTPETLAQRAREIAGGAIGKRSPASSKLRSPAANASHQQRRATDGISPATTPSRSGLRDRRSIREKAIYDPSPQTTPTKRPRPTSDSGGGRSSSSTTAEHRTAASPLPHTSSKAARFAAAASPTSKPATPSTRHKTPIRGHDDTAPALLLGYHTFAPDTDWDAAQARTRVAHARARVNAMLVASQAAVTS